MNECVNYRLFDSYRINRARIVTEAARRLNVWIKQRELSVSVNRGEKHKTPGRTCQQGLAQSDQFVRVFYHLLINQALEYDAIVCLHILKFDTVTYEGRF